MLLSKHKRIAYADILAPTCLVKELNGSDGFRFEYTGDSQFCHNSRFGHIFAAYQVYVYC